ncbi:MAG: NADP-dependent malic enzyme [Chloroflexota bacterium]
MAKITKEDALRYHFEGRPGKIEVIPTKPHRTQRDLSLAYSPGVAYPCLEIEKNKDDIYKYTSKGNLVAVISNGTAVLGLGDIGADAGKPVMEGKGLLFKIFADIDVFDIEVDTHDVEKFIDTVKNIAVTFGGINLEDIKAPECFEIEERLKKELQIPLMHDDQHGTAIITAAGWINAMEIAGKKKEDAKIVVNGAGASAIACTKMLVSVGAKVENIVMLDTKGVLRKDRTDLNKYKQIFATDRDIHTLTEAVAGADVFLGLSTKNILSQDMVRSMADNPIVFAMANPDPEIRYELAKEARPDSIVATGRSDYPNQINNVLGFPFIFRGALDVRAKTINEEMKFAASKALYNLAKEDVPDSVLRAYGTDSMKFGIDYIIPKPLDPRVLLWEAPAVAKAAMDTGVARKKIDMDEYKEKLAYRLGKGEQVRYFIMNKAKATKGKKRVTFGEGEETKIIRAAFQVQDEGIATPILIGNADVIKEKIKLLGLDFKPKVVDPNHFEDSEKYAEAFYQLRQRKGVVLQDAEKFILDPNILGSMMVKMGDAEAFVSGLTYDYPEVIRPALQIHHTAKGVTRAAGIYIMIVGDKTYFFTDPTVNIDPSAEDLSEIACLAAEFARKMEVEPRVAFLSFSNFGSTPHALSDKVRKAVELTKKRCDFVVEGEMQADTAVVPEIIEERYPFSAVKDANVLVFPSLESANIAYKLLARLGNAKAIGPILLGMGAPVHVIQTGDEVNDIVEIAAVAVMDAVNRQL